MPIIPALGRMRLENCEFETLPGENKTNIMIKECLPWEEVKILNVYVLDNKASKYMMQN
jgi:hypothetical protein